jgi:hypothetical protein
MTVQLLSAILGVVACFTIIFMVRRDQLISRDGAVWILIAVTIVILGLFPSLTDWLGQKLDIGYPPVLPILFAILIILVKLVKADIEKAHLKADIERLLQHQAILQTELSELRKQLK